MPNPSAPLGLPTLRPPSPLPHELSSSQISHHISHSSRSLLNRLRSIHQDSNFPLAIHSAYQGRLPLVVNKRAGEWYVPPSMRAGSVYFKSTDGHTGNWGFSLRRLNLNLLEIIAKGGGEGVIIVDSTRRGKRYPDSLSKTIPTWCTVLNNVLFPNPPTPHKLYTPPQIISPQECHYINALIPAFLSAFSSLDMNLLSLPHLPKKPLRPFFINPDDYFTPPEVDSNDKSQHLIFEEFIPIVLVSVSRVVKNDGIEGEYIQGAGDDAENWLKSIDLDPQTFWNHSQQILACENDNELINLIETIKQQQSQLVPTTTMSMGTTATYSITSDYTLNILANAPMGIEDPHRTFSTRQGEQYNIIIDLSTVLNRAVGNTSLAPGNTVDKPNQTPSILQLPLPQKGKPAKILRDKVLPVLLQFLQNSDRESKKPKTILVMSDEPGDISVALALFILSVWYTDSGTQDIPTSLPPAGIDKVYIRRRLAWIISTMGESVSVSRANLNSVNAVLMQRLD